MQALYKLNRPACLLITLTLLIFNGNALGQCPGTDVIQDPADFVWTLHEVSPNNPVAYYSGVMEVGEHTFTLNNGATLTTRAYRQQGGSYSIPGPTIRVEPGKKYVISFHNTLPYEQLSTSENVFKDPNASNFHTHGLHISGESPGDDITRAFEGGRGGDFVWDIPADHMGGTFWYHAHHHGSSFLQVSGGLFGMLIVDDSNDGIPSTVAAMDERDLAIAYLNPAAAGTGGDVLLGGTLSPTWTVNGLINGNICMPPNTWQHWRVLLADPDARMKTVEFGPGCEVKLLARDGVWRTIAPKELATNKLDLTGASRADIAIRASGNSWIRVGGTTVANIFTEGTANPDVHPFDLDGSSSWSALRPDYLRDLRNEPSVHLESISMGARTINGSKYNHHVPTLSLTADQVQEWSLSGAAMHPFHLHIYHVQALSTVGDFEAGEYYDVLAGNMSFRFDLSEASSSPYEGRTIMHCHVLDHEDRGAMGWLDVGGGGTPPPTFPVNGDLPPYSAYYVLGGGSPPSAPSNLTATALSSSAIQLDWTHNGTNEDGFNIERSSDGVNFSPLTSVAANTTSYTNSGLSASSTWHYRVNAFNTAGTSAFSNIASATTSGSSGVELHVGDISVVRAPLSGNRFLANATVTILDAADVPVSGATVSGIFTGPTSGTGTGTTNANGQVTLSSKAAKAPVGEWCFEVTDVSLAGATYDPVANVVTNVCESGPVFKPNPGISDSKTGGSMLIGIYPNPYGNSTKISFELKEHANVLLEVYSILGERVAVLTDRDFEAGQHLLEWNAPLQLSNGTYLLQMKAGNRVDTKRLVQLR